MTWTMGGSLADSSGRSGAIGPRASQRGIQQPATQSSYLRGVPNDESKNAVDGTITGSYSFHTNIEDRPWWQVDLKRVYALSEVSVYNTPGSTADRAYRLEIHVSYDGRSFTEVYQNNSKPFGGREGQPLRVALRDVSARYVRFQLAERSYLHLDEVFVMGREP